jgi:hypothetical protein
LTGIDKIGMILYYETFTGEGKIFRQDFKVNGIFDDEILLWVFDVI